MACEKLLPHTSDKVEAFTVVHQQTYIDNEDDAIIVLGDVKLDSENRITNVMNFKQAFIKIKKIIIPTENRIKRMEREIRCMHQLIHLNEQFHKIRGEIHKLVIVNTGLIDYVKSSEKKELSQSTVDSIKHQLYQAVLREKRPEQELLTAKTTIAKMDANSIQSIHQRITSQAVGKDVPLEKSGLANAIFLLLQKTSDILFLKINPTDEDLDTAESNIEQAGNLMPLYESLRVKISLDTENLRLEYAYSKMPNKNPIDVPKKAKKLPGPRSEDFDDWEKRLQELRSQHTRASQEKREALIAKAKQEVNEKSLVAKMRELSEGELKKREERTSKVVKNDSSIIALFQALYDFKFGYNDLNNLIKALKDKGEDIFLEHPSSGSTHFTIRIWIHVEMFTEDADNLELKEMAESQTTQKPVTESGHAFVPHAQLLKKLKNSQYYPDHIIENIQRVFFRSGYTPTALGIEASKKCDVSKFQFHKGIKP